MDEEIKKDESNDESHSAEASRDQYLNNWKRAVADLANYKKEEVARMGILLGYAKEGMFFNMLPIIDSIYLASNAFGKDGFMPIEKQIQEFLKKEGIEEIEVLGKKFDPNFMEATYSLDKDASNIVVEELQKGYIINGKVIRASRVKIG